jgi:hypothetical protein
MDITGGILAGGSLLSGLLGSSSAKKAAKTSADAQMRQMLAEIAFARENRDIGLNLSQPYRQGGYAAFAGLMDMVGLPRGSPMGTPEPGSPAPTGPGQPGKKYANDYKPATGGYKDGTYIPAAPKEWLGDPGKWETFVREFQKDPQQFLDAKGKYFNDPSGIIGPADPNNTRGLYGRSGKVWGQLLSGMTRDPTGTGIGAPYDLGQLGTPDLGSFAPYQFKQDPGYQFRLNEGMRGLENSAAARGGLLSGGFARDALSYGQDMASQEYMNVYNRLANIAGIGQVGYQGALGATGAAGQQMVGAAGGIGNAGAYRGQGYMGQGNAWQNAIGQFATLYGMFGQGGGTKSTQPVGGYGFGGNVPGWFGGVP